MNKLLKSLAVSRWLLVILIIIIASWLRLYNIVELPPGLYPDEAIYANNGVEAWETGNFKVFYPENNGREGLWSNIIGFFIIKFGHEPWVPRSVAAVFGILTVLGVYFLTKELFNIRTSDVLKIGENNLGTSDVPKLKIFRSENVALLSSFFLAVSFWHINFSRIGFRAIMAPFFLTWGLYFLLLTFRKIRESLIESGFIDKTNRFLILGSIFAGIFYGLGFHTYIAYRATPLLILIVIGYWLMVNKEWQIRKKTILVALLFSLFALIVFAPLGLYFLNNPQDFFGRTTQISIFNSPTPIKDLAINILKTAGMFNFSGDWNWRHNVAGKPLLFWPIGILFLIGIFLAFKNLVQNLKFKIRNNNLNSILETSDVPNIDENFRTPDVKKLKFGFLILFSWLVVTALPVVVSNEGIPHALRAILMAPAVFILAGIGGVWLYEFIKLRMSILGTSDVPQSSTPKTLPKICKRVELPEIKTNFSISQDRTSKQNNYQSLESPISGTSNVQKFKLAKMKIFNIFVFILLSLFVFGAYNTYFVKWSKNPNVYGAFNADYVQIGRKLNNLPKDLPKYVVVEAAGVDVRGIPMPAQTVMFITNTFTPEKQKEKNIYYILPNQINQITEGSYIVILK